MKYQYSLILRLTLILIFTLTNFLYLIIKPITLYSLFLIFLPFNTTLKNSSIIINNTEFNLIPACIAITAYILLAVLILLTKDLTIKTTIKLFLIGSLLILVANLIRISILILLWVYKNIYLFNTIHLFFWKFVASIYVAFVWIFLIKKYKIKSIPLIDDYKYLIKLRKKKVC